MRAENAEQYLAALPDGVLVVGPNGVIRYASHQLEALSGYSRVELVGTPVEKLVPERMRGEHEEHRARYHAHPVVRSMGSHLDIHLRRKDGGDLPVDISLGYVESDGETLVVASVRDIAERRRAEAALRRANEQVNLLVQSVSDYAIFSLDPEGRVSSWNPGAARINGYSADEVLGKGLAVFYPPEAVAEGAPAQALADAAAGTHNDEGWRVRKDGSRFWASATLTAMRDGGGELRGFSKIVRDVTERKRQEDRVEAMLAVAQAILQECSDDQLMQLVASRARSLRDADDAVVLTSGDDGDGADQVYGPDAALVVGAADGERAAGLLGVRLRLAEELTPAGEPRVLPDVAQAIHMAGDHHQPLAGPGMIVPLRAGGHELGALLLVRVPGRPPPEARAPEQIAPFAAQAAVAMDYARARRELEQLAVYEDRERIGRELHDGAIQALFSVGMNLQGMAQIATSANLRERTNVAVAQIDAVIRDLRNYIFGLRPGLAADGQLGHALQDLAEGIERESGVACAVDLDQTVVPEVAGRVGDLVQLTREALSNVARHAQAATCRISLYREDEQAVLEIDDDGVGFAVDRVGGGGMGLGNLRSRMASLGGTLDLTSVPGEGTTVTCRIPLRR
jgi:PAS domain S-box-containing protein